MQIQPQSEWMMPRPQGVLGSPVSMPGFQTGFGQSDTVAIQRPGLPAQLSQAVKPKSTEAQKKKQDHGNASRWVTAYKLGFSLCVAGAANAFLFGVPLWWAGGLSAIVAGAQSAIALKVHKEDTDFSKKLVKSTRKMMHRENDKTPAGKEWSMVPIWGMACGSMGLLEAGFNHLYSLRNPQSKDANPMADRLKAIEANIDKDGLLKPLYKLQKSGMEFTQRVTTRLSENVPHHLGRVQPRLKVMYEWGLNKLTNNVKGNPKAGYVLGFIMAGIGGIAQTSIAAKIQERIDNNQATNPKALLGAVKNATPLKKLESHHPENNAEKKPTPEPVKKTESNPSAPKVEEGKSPIQPPVTDEKNKSKQDDEVPKTPALDPKLPVQDSKKEDESSKQDANQQPATITNPWQKPLPEKQA